MRFSVVAVSLLAVLLSGCARQINSNVYKAGHVGEASMSYQGTIISVRQVTVDEGEYLGENTTGMAVGGVAGGLLGSTMGGGKGNLAMTLGGAALGATAGALAEKELKTQQGFEYVVKLTNGQIMTVVQGLDQPMRQGQRVLVLVSQEGRSRIIPDNSPADVQPLAPTASSVVIKHK